VKVAPFPGRSRESVEIPLSDTAVSRPAELHSIDVQNVRDERSVPCLAPREQDILHVEVMMSRPARGQQANEARRTVE
jgi:hypothetical protein